MSFCPKCNEVQKPDNIRVCMPCARKKSFNYARFSFFTILFIGLYVFIYQDITALSPKYSSADQFLNYFKALINPKYSEWAKQQATTMALVVVASFVVFFAVRTVILKRNSK